MKILYTLMYCIKQGNNKTCYPEISVINRAIDNGYDIIKCSHCGLEIKISDIKELLSSSG